VVGKVIAPLKGDVEGAVQGLDDFANVRAVKAATGQNKAVLKKVARTKGIEEAGDALLNGEDKVIGFGSSVDKIKDRAADAADKAWAQVQGVHKAIDAAKDGKSIDGGEIAKAIVEKANRIEPLDQNLPIIDKMRSTAAYFERKGPMSLEHAQELKNNFVFKFTDPKTHALGLDGNNAIREAFTEKMGDAVASADPALAKVWQDGMQKYGVYAETAGAASDRAVANVSNRLISPSDYAVGATAALHSGMKNGAEGVADTVRGVAAALAHKLVRERGSSAAAITAKNLAGILESAPEALGSAYGVLAKAAEGGPAALEATHMMLLKSDENYRKLLEPQQPQPSGAPMVGPKSELDQKRDAIKRRLSE
jgi:hypothetical protein